MCHSHNNATPCFLGNPEGTTGNKRTEIASMADPREPRPDQNRDRYAPSVVVAACDVSIATVADYGVSVEKYSLWSFGLVVLSIWPSF